MGVLFQEKGGRKDQNGHTEQIPWGMRKILALSCSFWPPYPNSYLVLGAKQQTVLLTCSNIIPFTTDFFSSWQSHTFVLIFATPPPLRILTRLDHTLKMPWLHRRASWQSLDVSCQCLELGAVKVGLLFLLKPGLLACSCPCHLHYLFFFPPM